MPNSMDDITNPTILISLETNEEVLQQLQSILPNADIRMGPHLEDEGFAMDKKLMTGTDVLLCEFPPDNFHDFDQLKWVQVSSSGYSQILHLPLLENDIRVTNGLGNFDVPIAEWNVMMMLMWHRHMLDMLQNQEDHVWDRDARFQSELRGSVIGFYGYGGIARETARLARTMGLQRWALTRDGTAKKRDLVYCVEGTGDPDGVLCDRIFGPNQKEEFLSQVDYLVIAIPITPATEGSIGADELKMLKPSAVIINPARAGLIEEKVLLQCLTEQWIRGLSLDVHYAYPLPPDHPLWSTPNVILTPHISGSAASTHFLTRVYDIFAKNIERFISNKPLLNQLTPAQLRGE